jgi:hypothetical protein
VFGGKGADPALVGLIARSNSDFGWHASLSFMQPNGWELIGGDFVIDRSIEAKHGHQPRHRQVLEIILA